MSDFNKNVLSYTFELQSKIYKCEKSEISAEVNILINSIIAPTVDFIKIKEDIK